MPTTAMPSLLFPHSVRDRVLEQHGRLRELLRLALEASGEAHPFQGDGCSRLASLQLCRYSSETGGNWRKIGREALEGCSSEAMILDAVLSRFVEQSPVTVM